MVTGLQEVGCLVVFIQNFDLEVGESWQGVTIVLLCLKVKVKAIIHYLTMTHIIKPLPKAMMSPVCVSSASWVYWQSQRVFLDAELEINEL